jgi:hypothetical protein
MGEVLGEQPQRGSEGGGEAISMAETRAVGVRERECERRGAVRRKQWTLWAKEDSEQRLECRKGFGIGGERQPGDESIKAVPDELDKRVVEGCCTAAGSSGCRRRELERETRGGGRLLEVAARLSEEVREEISHERKSVCGGQRGADDSKKAGVQRRRHQRRKKRVSGDETIGRLGEESKGLDELRGAAGGVQQGREEMKRDRGRGDEGLTLSGD